ncbi:MAG: hydrogenase subunit MbhD domain-containing protein [Candidatus Cloacimonadales bacterium]
MINLAIILMGILMIAAAIYAFRTKKLINAIIASGAISLIVSVIFIILAAPDVAMTEASIGSALTTIVFLFALSKVKSKIGEKGGDDA